MSLWTLITGVPDQSEQDADLAAAQQRLADAIAARQASGDPVPEDILVTDTGLESETNDNVDAAAAAGFGEGLQDGINNVLNAPGKATGAIGDALSQALGGILKNVPWWAYVGAAVALFVWMGGLELLRGRLAKH